jgi:Flp pilus assembly CpaE family ATPase
VFCRFYRSLRIRTQPKALAHLLMLRGGKPCIRSLQITIYDVEFSCVLSFQNQKGGVGKTTLALHIAYCFASIPESLGQPRRVLVLDAELR